jgi:penicillin-binding protein 1A
MDDSRPLGNTEKIGTKLAASQLARAIWNDVSCWTWDPSRSARTRGCISFVGGALLGVLVVSLSAAGALLWVLHGTPLQTRSGFEGASLLVEASDGTPIGRVGALADAVDRDEIPDLLVNAVVSIEDRRFYKHRGVDLRGVLRAGYANWNASAIVEGGSTITQQLAKLELVGNDRNFGRKLREALLAIWLEATLGKDEILTRYLNAVYLGAGTYGMAAAARHYFDKKLGELELSEAAMLAGIIQAPTRFNPIANPEAAQARTALVLDAMVEENVIDRKNAMAAKATPAVVRPARRTEPASSWFADWITRHEFPKVAGTTSRPMRVRTSLDRNIQIAAEQTIRQALARDGSRLGSSQAALVAMRPDGAVLAMVGGRDYGESQFNRAVDARRQPGSAFKLFVFYAALRQGYRPDDLIDASPIAIKSWKPENYGGQVYGDLTLSNAFAHSVNSAAVRLALTVGLGNVVSAARELGLTSPLPELPSMALGTNEVSLLEITGAFASVRAGRPRFEPWGIAAFGTESGGLRRLSTPERPAKELPHQREITDMLRRVVTSGTGRGAALADGSSAGKTGTSQDYRDAWFVGFSDELVVGVWVGNDDRTPMKNVTGGSLPASIWREFVTTATPMIDKPREPAADTVAVEAPDTNAAPKCDVQACTAAFSSFRASDCTYQPFAGPRRLCEFRPTSGEAFPQISRASSIAGASCNVSVCASRFRSFDAASCTYQPYGGGARAICDVDASH